MSFGGSSSPSVPGTPPDFMTFLQNVLNQDLTPILHIVTTIAYFIGFCLILMGLSRLYHHGHPNSSHHNRVTPMGTSMFFIVGVVLISSMPYLQMMSSAFVQLNEQSAMMTQCTGPVLNDSGFYTASNNFCPMTAYATDISNAVSDNDAVAEGIQYAVFAVAFLVGVIAFIRGMLLLLKIGEGGQGGHVGKAFTFIFAGIVGVNMSSFYDLLNNMLTSNTTG
jgi:hypothetical protein